MSEYPVDVEWVEQHQNSLKRLNQDFIRVLGDMARLALLNSRHKGFWEEEDRVEEIPEALRAAFVNGRIGLTLDLIHCELSEMLDDYKKGVNPSEKTPKFSNVEEEAADVLIRLMDFCAYRGIRLGEATIAKMMYNAGRPRKHGGNF